MNKPFPASVLDNPDCLVRMVWSAPRRRCRRHGGCGIRVCHRVIVVVIVFDLVFARLRCRRRRRRRRLPSSFVVGTRAWRLPVMLVMFLLCCCCCFVVVAILLLLLLLQVENDFEDVPTTAGGPWTPVPLVALKAADVNAVLRNAHTKELQNGA